MAHWLTTPATCGELKILFCCFYDNTFSKPTAFWQQLFTELVQVS
jgi:hypothetical protein